MPDSGADGNTAGKLTSRRRTGANKPGNGFHINMSVKSTNGTDILRNRQWIAALQNKPLPKKSLKLILKFTFSSLYPWQIDKSINIIYQKQDKSNIVREIYWLYITKRASFILTVDCWLALLSLPPYLHILCSMDINSSLLYFPYQSRHRSNHTRHRRHPM